MTFGCSTEKTKMAAATVGKAARAKKRGDSPPSKNGTNRRSKTNGHGSDFLDPELLLTVLTAVKNGDFSGRVPARHGGISGRIYDTLNEIIEKNEMLTSELGRISEVVGKEGKIAQRATMRDASGGWASCIDSVNTLITDLAQPTTEVARDRSRRSGRSLAELQSRDRRSSAQGRVSPDR
jgi:hypothetical protein